MSRINLTRIAGVIIFSSMILSAAFAQTYNVLTSFTGPNGGTAYGPLIQGADGRLYGTTNWAGGGFYPAGTVFRITTSGALTTLNNFCPTSTCTASGPEVGVTQGIDGYFYGTTSGNASIFKMNSAGKMAILHTFPSGSGWPGINGLIQSADSNLYGLTDFGSNGSVYKITPAGVFTTVAALNGNPEGLTQSPQGNFYIALASGGAHNFGAIQKMTPDGTVSTLYDFCPQNGCSDGQYPGANVVVGNDGNIYGTTTEGGPNGGGTVFKLTPTGKLTTLYSFCAETNCADGWYPLGLMQGADGNLYGVTYYGGPNAGNVFSGGAGTLYKITPTGSFTQLYSFCSQTNCADGSNPFGGLVQDTNGKFYGTTNYGGENASNCPAGYEFQPCGTVFSLSVGLGPFVALPINTAPAGTTVGILGQGLSGTASVTFNGTPAAFTIKGDTYLTATVPSGATSGRVKVTTSSGSLTSNRIFYVQP